MNKTYHLWTRHVAGRICSMRSVVRYDEELHHPWIIVLSMYNIYCPWIVHFIHGQQYPRMKRNITVIRAQSKAWKRLDYRSARQSALMGRRDIQTSCPTCKAGHRGIKCCVAIPGTFQRKVRRNLRATRRAGLTAPLRKKRKLLGRAITQWRKSESRTEATAEALPAVVAKLKEENASLRTVETIRRGTM